MLSINQRNCAIADSDINTSLVLPFNSNLVWSLAVPIDHMMLNYTHYILLVVVVVVGCCSRSNCGMHSIRDNIHLMCDYKSCFQCTMEPCPWNIGMIHNLLALFWDWKPLSFSLSLSLSHSYCIVYIDARKHIHSIIYPISVDISVEANGMSRYLSDSMIIWVRVIHKQLFCLCNESAPKMRSPRCL